jgi:FMN phosphatase YigB (HAD superfamily)
MLDRFTTLLLDMNGTFMFDGDRFDLDRDYAIFYHQLGGKLPADRVNWLVQKAYDYLNIRYPDPAYRESFPSLQEALLTVDSQLTSQLDLDLLIETFARHELGTVPVAYSTAIERLSKRFRLGLVIDIWAPKTLWIEELNRCGILPLCDAASFSSDCGMVKPSPQPFRSVLDRMQVNPQDAVVIGDSVSRDLGGALAAGIDCILVGSATDPSAIGCVTSLLELADL